MTSIPFAFAPDPTCAETRQQLRAAALDMLNAPLMPPDSPTVAWEVSDGSEAADAVLLPGDRVKIPFHDVDGKVVEVWHSSTPGGVVTYRVAWRVEPHRAPVTTSFFREHLQLLLVAEAAAVGNGEG